MAAANSNRWFTDPGDDESSSDGSQDSEDEWNTYDDGNSRQQSETSRGIPANGALQPDQVDENETIYSNEMEPTRPVESSVIQEASNSSSMVLQLREQLQLRIERRKQPTLGVKPKLMEKSPEVMKHARNKQLILPPQQSLRSEGSPEKLMASPELTKNIGTPNMQQTRRYQLPPKPMNASRIVPTPNENPRSLPKPPPNPPRVSNLNTAAAFLPKKADFSDGCDYEPMQQRYEGPGSMKNDESTQSTKGSNESLYHSPDISGPEDNEEVYETIAEKVFDSQPEAREQCLKLKPDRLGLAAPVRPAPPRPPQSADLPKPKKYDTCRSIACQPSRPLPLPPKSPQLEKPVESPEKTYDISAYKSKPWFHNIGRAEAIALIGGGKSESSTVPPDGYFLLRPPAKARMTQHWTLVLWYKNKTYNIAVRKRPDLQYALGTVKPHEMAFASIEEMVDFYKKNELVLNSGSGDAGVGRTRLTETPPKKRD